MITNFRAYNFYSIGKEISIDFTKNGTTPENGYFKIKETPSKITNVSLINGFFGSNASGKTNILRGISTLIRLMYNLPFDNINQFQPTDKDKFRIVRNFHKSFDGQPIKLGADFLFNDNLYKFDIHFSEEGEIIHEKLEANLNYSAKSSKSVVIYYRSKGQKTKTGPNYKDYEEYLNKAEPISNLFWLCRVLSLDFTNDFKDKFLMWNVGNDGMDFLNTIVAGLRILKDSHWTKNNALEAIPKALKLFDHTISGIDVKEIDNRISTRVKHTDFSDSILIENESRGTQELFTYLFDIILVLRNGGVVIYDEINRFYHPDIQNEIFNLFLKTINEHHAQLIFSSHDHDIMNELDLDQLNLVEKEDYETINSKLSEIKDVKSRDNIAKKYRLGIYGAVPDTLDFSYGLNEII